jgi:PAS domain S-box-containing protein
MSHPVLDAAPDAALVVDEDGRALDVNRAAEDMFGRDSAELIGTPISELVDLPPGGSLETIGRARVAARRPDGADSPAELTVTRTSERPPRYTAWIRDLTGSDASERLRKETLLELGEVVGQLGSWEWLPAKGDLFWTDNLYRLFGYAPGEIEPSPEFVFERLHPDDRERVEQEVNALRRAGRLHPLEYRVLLRDGTSRDLRSILAVVEERDGRPWRMVGSVRDVTDQRGADREISAHVAVAHALARWSSLEEDAARLLRDLARSIEFTAGALWAPEDDALVAHAYWHSEAAEAQAFEAEMRGRRLTPGTGLPGRVWQTRAPINAVGIHADPAYPGRDAAAQAGLRGAVAFPAIAGDEVLAVVELLSRDEAPLPKRLMRSLTWIGYEIGQFLVTRRGELLPPSLTPRELEVLQLAAVGKSGPRIAKELFVSPTTVKTHFEHIYSKLGVPDRPSAVAAALRLGLIE